MIKLLSTNKRGLDLDPGEDKFRPTLNASHFRFDNAFEPILGHPIQDVLMFGSMWPNDAVIVGASYYEGAININLYTSYNRLSLDQRTRFNNEFQAQLQMLLEKSKNLDDL